MADIVNLRAARKRKTRSDKALVAAENRTRFGRPKSAKLLEEANAHNAARHLDQHRIDRDEER